MTGLLIHNCEVAGHADVDVRVRDGCVAEVGADLSPDGDDVIDGRGGALLPGLHDHHLHLFALAAELESVRCGPSDVRDVDEFVRVLRSAAQSGAVRATGYHESVAGVLDRDRLDAIVPGVPVRVQHRSGAVWFLNSAALSATGLMDHADPAVEREPDGRPTGRLRRGDHLLPRDGELPDLTAVGRLLAACGVTGVTDATPQLDARQVTALRTAYAEGVLPQEPLLLGAGLGDPEASGAPWKVLVDEVRDLDAAAIVTEVRAARRAGRPVALHCTSRAETVLAVTVLRECGGRPGDRLEHAGVLPRELDVELAQMGITVVTQPHFITDRGDDYLADVEPADHELLYRCGSLVDGGVRVAGGSDAPYGRPDPWHAIAAAIARRTRRGRVVAAGERLDPARALELFLGAPLDPGGPPRRVTAGTAADLCLLTAPLAEALAEPRADLVAATVIAGRMVHRTAAA